MHGSRQRSAAATRSFIMSRVRSANSRAERRVRSYLHSSGFRFRLHAQQLPGAPDIVLPMHRAIVFVHGCFWHRHAGCGRARMPKSNVAYWGPKLRGNAKRDKRVRKELNALGWRVFVIWECEIGEGSLANLARSLRNSSLPRPTAPTPAMHYPHRTSQRVARPAATRARPRRTARSRTARPAASKRG